MSKLVCMVAACFLAGMFITNQANLDNLRKEIKVLRERINRVESDRMRLDEKIVEMVESI